MNIAIMQPYLFPYLGYFQLIAAVDKFVFYDDVNFIKNGWINRNRLLLSGEVRYLTIPLAGASSFSKINEVLVQDRQKWARKIVESVRQSYSKAPKLGAVANILLDVLLSEETHISEIAKKSVVAVSKYLELKTEFVMSSSLFGNSELKGVDRVIDICHKENADRYTNLPGGKVLYDGKAFEEKGIALQFIEPELPNYQQSSAEFVPGLSIVDVLMFNDVKAVREMLKARTAA